MLHMLQYYNEQENDEQQILHFNFKREYLCAKVNCNIDMESCNYALIHNTKCGDIHDFYNLFQQVEQYKS